APGGDDLDLLCGRKAEETADHVELAPRLDVPAAVELHRVLRLHPGRASGDGPLLLHRLANEVGGGDRRGGDGGSRGPGQERGGNGTHPVEHGTPAAGGSPFPAPLSAARPPPCLPFTPRPPGPP